MATGRRKTQENSMSVLRVLAAMITCLSTISCVTVEQANATPQVATTVSVTSVAVSEKDGSVTIPISLSHPSSVALQVRLETFDASASQGSDYNRTAESVTVPAGSTAEVVSIPILNDTVLEESESFSVRIISVSSGIIGTSNAIVTISDDDQQNGESAFLAAQAVAENASCGNPNVTQADQGTFIWSDCGTGRWHVRVAAANTVQYYRWMNYRGFVSSDLGVTDVEAVRINTDYFDKVVKDGSKIIGYTLNLSANTGTEGFDFTAPPGSNVCFKVTTALAPNPLPIYVGKDRNRASRGKFNPENLSQCGSESSQPHLFLSDVRVDEQSGTATVNVQMSQAATSPVTVLVSTVPGTAKGDGVDYLGLSDTITFDAGETQVPVDIKIVDDAVTEGQEKFGVRLASPVGAVIRDSEAVVTIEDNDGSSDNPGQCGPGTSITTLTNQMLRELAPVKKEDLAFYCPSRTNRNTSGIRPESYGAVGNGSKDDTNALVAAAKAAAQYNSFLTLTSGKTYLTSRQIPFENGARGIISNGSGKARLRAAKGLAPWMILLQSVGRQRAISNFVIQDVEFDMNRSAAKYAIFGQNAKKISIYDSTFTNLGPKNGGMFFRAYKGLGDLEDICIERNKLYGQVADDNPAHGIFIDGTGISIMGEAAEEYWKNTNLTVPTTTKAKRIRIRDNEVTGGYYGIGMTQGSYSLIANNKVTSNVRNIKLQNNTHHNIIDSNECNDARSTSILLSFRPQFNVITNNRCKTSRGAAWGMIDLNLNPKGNVVANNQLSSPTAKPAHYYGVYVAIDAENNHVFGNKIGGHFLKAYVGVESSWKNHPNPYHRSSGSRWESKGSNGQQVIANTFGPIPSNVPLVFLGQAAQRLTNTNIKCNRLDSPTASLPSKALFKFTTTNGGISGGDSSRPFTR